MILLPWGNPLWVRYVSHKLMRLLVPFAMVILFIVSLLLSGGFFRIFTFLQSVFYGIALMGFLLPATRLSRIINLGYKYISTPVSSAECKPNVHSSVCGDC